jgi:hypothetical protein
MALGSQYTTLDATISVASANSYATIAEADDYHDGRVSTYTADWTGAATEIKEDALMEATRLLDLYVAWNGTKSDITFTSGIPDQPLAWPRSGVVGPEGETWPATVIPVWLKIATAELARSIIAKERTKEPIRGIDRIKTGEVEIDFDTIRHEKILVRTVRSMVAPYGKIKEGGLTRRIARV